MHQIVGVISQIYLEPAYMSSFFWHDLDLFMTSAGQDS